MGAGGIPNRTIEIVEARSLPKKGKPNSRVDRLNNGKKVQSRWYNEQGQAVRNRDYSHSGEMNFPHDHKWQWSGDNGNRENEHLTPDYENFY